MLDRHVDCVLSASLSIYAFSLEAIQEGKPSEEEVMWTRQVELTLELRQPPSMTDTSCGICTISICPRQIQEPSKAISNIIYRLVTETL